MKTDVALTQIRNEIRGMRPSFFEAFWMPVGAAVAMSALVSVLASENAEHDANRETRELAVRHDALYSDIRKMDQAHSQEMIVLRAELRKEIEAAVSKAEASRAETEDLANIVRQALELSEPVIRVELKEGDQ